MIRKAVHTRIHNRKEEDAKWAAHCAAQAELRQRQPPPDQGDREGWGNYIPYDTSFTYIAPEASSSTIEERNDLTGEQLTTVSHDAELLPTKQSRVTTQGIKQRRRRA